MSKKKKLLIITSSGGGGLLQTANAKAQAALAHNPNLIIIKKDLMKDWIPFGFLCVKFWNKAQSKGNVWAQIFFLKGQPILDFFIHPLLFFRVLYTLLREDVDEVIDTQPIGTSAIVRALSFFNRKRNKSVKIEKVVVDLPTKEASHFFRSIKKLGPKMRSLLKLTSIAPLVEPGQTREEFWQTHCGLSDEEINYEDFYVRAAFLAYKEKPRSRSSLHITPHVQNKEEETLIAHTIKRGPLRATSDFSLILPPEVIVATILLGSQPAVQATINYVKGWLQCGQEHPDREIYVFVFCGAKGVLQKEVAKLVKEYEPYPQNISIVPLSFQGEEVIAPLFHRSDATCTRSGGQTAMELMCVSTGQVWIHSEAKPGEDLLKGIPGWEAASADYLQKMHQAKILTPASMLPAARSVIGNTK